MIYIHSIVIMITQVKRLISYICYSITEFDLYLLTITLISIIPNPESEVDGYEEVKDTALQNMAPKIHVLMTMIMPVILYSYYPCFHCLPV